MRTLRLVLAAAAAITLVSTADGSASAATRLFPGAGFQVTNVKSMTVRFHIPAVTCTPGLNTAALIGMISPDIGLPTQWNGTALVGCNLGRPWYRIQAWVSGLGATYSVDPANAGDYVEAKLTDASSRHPTITVTDWTTQRRVASRLMRPTSVAATGMYGGYILPKFSTVDLASFANGGKTLAQLVRQKHALYRRGTLLVGTGSVWRDGYHNRLYFRHR